MLVFEDDFTFLVDKKKFDEGLRELAKNNIILIYKIIWMKNQNIR
jgi:hypothetical protein